MMTSPVTGEFPAQRPVTRSFGVFFDLRLNKRLSKQCWCWWFETPSSSLWPHCNEFGHCLGTRNHNEALNGSIHLKYAIHHQRWHCFVIFYIFCNLWNPPLKTVSVKIDHTGSVANLLTQFSFKSGPRSKLFPIYLVFTYIVTHFLFIALCPMHHSD